jgi:hypothetical protein
MKTTWELLSEKIKYRKVPIHRLGNREYLRSTRRDSNWYGDLRGVRFHIELSKGEDYCILSSKERLKDLEDALVKILKAPAIALGIRSKNILKYETIFAATNDLLEFVVEKRQKIGFKLYENGG